MMTALLNSKTNPGDGLGSAGEPEVVKFYIVSELSGATKQPDVCFSAQCAFEGKCFASA